MFKIKRLINHNYILKTYNYLLLRLLEIVIFFKNYKMDYLTIRIIKFNKR